MRNPITGERRTPPVVANAVGTDVPVQVVVTVKQALSAGATQFGQFVPGFSGVIKAAMARVLTAGAPAGASARSITPRINGTNVTGGVVSVDGSNTATAGRYIMGSDVTGGNTFDPNDRIDFDLAAQGLTAFTDGEIEMVLILESR